MVKQIEKYDEPKSIVKTDSGCAGYFVTCSDGSIWVYSDENKRFILIKSKE